VVTPLHTAHEDARGGEPDIGRQAAGQQKQLHQNRHKDLGLSLQTQQQQHAQGATEQHIVSLDQTSTSDKAGHHPLDRSSERAQAGEGSEGTFGERVTVAGFPSRRDQGVQSGDLRSDRRWDAHSKAINEAATHAEIAKQVNW